VLYRRKHNRTSELILQNAAYINWKEEAAYENQTHELE
jgi:hypothetical protein